MKKQIFWLDDEPLRLVREHYRLTRLGHQVHWAHDLAEARTLLAKVPFDLLLIDQLVPHAKEDIRLTDLGAVALLHWLRRGNYETFPRRGEFSREAYGDEYGAVEPSSPIGRNRNAPFFIISALAPMATSEDDPSDYADRIIRKPIAIDYFVTKCQRALGLRP